MHALEDIMGIEEESIKVKDRFVHRSTSNCDSNVGNSFDSKIGLRDVPHDPATADKNPDLELDYPKHFVKARVASDTRWADINASKIEVADVVAWLEEKVSGAMQQNSSMAQNDVEQIISDLEVLVVFDSMPDSFKQSAQNHLSNITGDDDGTYNGWCCSKNGSSSYDLTQYDLEDGTRTVSQKVLPFASFKQHAKKKLDKYKAEIKEHVRAATEFSNTARASIFINVKGNMRFDFFTQICLQRFEMTQQIETLHMDVIGKDPDHGTHLRDIAWLWEQLWFKKGANLAAEAEAEMHSRTEIDLMRCKLDHSPRTIVQLGKILEHLEPFQNITSLNLQQNELCYDAVEQILKNQKSFLGSNIKSINLSANPACIESTKATKCAKCKRPGAHITCLRCQDISYCSTQVSIVSQVFVILRCTGIF